MNDPSLCSKIAAPEGPSSLRKNCEVVIKPTPQGIRAFSEGMERKLASLQRSLLTAFCDIAAFHFHAADGRPIGTGWKVARVIYDRSMNDLGQ